MKELDFDELDKAVNSLMGTSTANSDDDTTKVSTPEASTQPSPPVQSTPSPQTPPRSSPIISSSDRAATKQSIPTKRSGRFMDVVHPSSDMTTSSTSRPTRRPAILTPVNADVSSEMPEVSSSNDDAPVNHSKPSFTPVASHSDWPDPLDMHDFAQETPVTNDEADIPTETTSAEAETHTDADDELFASIEEPKEEPTEQDIPEAEPQTPPQTPPIVTSAPLSPFLADAVVEKRPLGGATNADVVSSTDAAVSAELSEASEPDEVLQSPPSSPLPAEFHDELLKIESGEQDTEPLTEAPSITSNNTQKDAPVIQNVPSDHAPTPPISIAQQYRQQPRSGDQSHAAVYDNAAQPLAHPAKQKSGWLTTFVIMLLLIIAGGGAAALFYFGYV